MTYYERRLPHWQPEGKALLVTWRLRGSLPAAALAKMKSTLPCTRGARGQECPRHRAPTAGEVFLLMDRALDRAATGPTWLRDRRAAAVLVETLRRGELELGHYRLYAFVVMPNHVHILIEPKTEAAKALKGLKGASARKINEILGRTGLPFWQDESFDHWVRDAGEMERIRSYIERNPVSAGLAGRPEEWPWSSAFQPQ